MSGPQPPRFFIVAILQRAPHVAYDETSCLRAPEPYVIFRATRGRELPHSESPKAQPPEPLRQKDRVQSTNLESGAGFFCCAPTEGALDRRRSQGL